MMSSAWEDQTEVNIRERAGGRKQRADMPAPERPSAPGVDLALRTTRADNNRTCIERVCARLPNEKTASSSDWLYRFSTEAKPMMVASIAPPCGVPTGRARYDASEVLMGN